MNLNDPLGVVTPTIDGALLGVLARVDRKFTPGDLQRHLGRYSQEGIRRSLRRLVAQGIVIESGTLNAGLFSFNRRHLASGAVYALATMRDTLLSQITDLLKGWGQAPTYASLFGSAARGDMRLDSDIDLFLIRPDRVGVDDVEWEHQLEALADTVTAWTGNDTRVLTYAAEQTRGSSEPVLHAIADEGLTLWGPPNWLVSALRASSDMHAS